MEWQQITITTTHQGKEIVGGLLVSHGVRGFVTQDPEDFQEFLEDTTVHWDYIEEDLLSLKEGETTVTFYLPENLQGAEMLGAIRAGLTRLPGENPTLNLGSLELKMDTVREEDWSTAWKKYYHPVRVGKRLVICPCWETADLNPGDVQVTLDPGMAFGTGTHETTRLCMQLLEDYLKPGQTVLDVGTGSGILAITALLLGAQSATGVDIDQLSVKIAGENAALNGVEDKLTLIAGDLTQKVDGKFDLICANIVADVILRLCGSVTQFMNTDTVLLVSGIIEDRKDQVVQGLLDAGLEIVEQRQENDWCAMACKLKEG